MILFNIKAKTKIYYKYIQYYTYKIFKMEEYFLKKEKQIEELTKDLDNRKYARLCLIEFIDEGAKFSIDETSINLIIERGIEPISYKEKSAYLTKIANIYDRINESLDKINIQFEPYSVNVITNSDSSLKLIINIKKPPVKKSNRGYSSYSMSMY